MSPHQRISLRAGLLCSLLLCAVSTQVAAQQNAIPILREPAAPAIQLAQPIPPGNEDQKLFQDRLRDYLACWQNWVRTVAELDEQQTLALEKWFGQKIPEFVRAYNSTNPSSGTTAGQLPDLFPILFANQRSMESLLGAFRAVPDGLKGILRPEQVQKFVDAERERREFRLAANRDYCLAILDTELFLSQAQREALIADREFLDPLLDLPFYAIKPSSTLFSYKPIATIISGPAIAKLSPAQRLRLTSLSAPAPTATAGRSLMFESTNSREAWDSQLDAYIQERRADLLCTFDLRLEYCQREAGLTQEHMDRLRVAAKGAVVKVCDDTRTSIQSQLDQIEPQMRRQVGTSRFSMGTSTVTPATLLAHPIWTAAWNAVMQDVGRNVELQRVDRGRNARDRAVLALLDRELWLRPQQREQLLPLLSAVLPPTDFVAPTREVLRDVTWLAHALLLTDENQLKTVLDAAQLAAWKQMQSSFQIAEGPTTIARLRLKTGGQTSIQLYRPNPQVAPAGAANLPAPPVPQIIEQQLRMQLLLQQRLEVPPEVVPIPRQR